MSLYISDKSYQLTSIAEPGINDVMCGRGGGTNNHIGNRRFRMLVNTHKPRYFKAPKLDKPKVAREVMILWREQAPPGRFLGRDSKTGLWNDVGDQKAREKASQCLRERRVSTDKKRSAANDNDDDECGNDSSNEEDNKFDPHQQMTAPHNSNGSNNSSMPNPRPSSSSGNGKKKKNRKMTPREEFIARQKHDIEAFDPDRQRKKKAVLPRQVERHMTGENIMERNRMMMAQQNNAAGGVGVGVGGMPTNGMDAVSLQQQMMLQQQMLQQQQQNVYQNVMQQLQVLQQGRVGVNGAQGLNVGGVGGVMAGMGAMGMAPGMTPGAGLPNNAAAADVGNLLMMQNILQLQQQMQHQQHGMNMPGMGMMGQNLPSGTNGNGAIDMNSIAMNLLQNQYLAQMQQQGQAQGQPSPLTPMNNVRNNNNETTTSSFRKGLNQKYGLDKQSPSARNNSNRTIPGAMNNSMGNISKCSDASSLKSINIEDLKEWIAVNTPHTSMTGGLPASNQRSSATREQIAAMLANGQSSLNNSNTALLAQKLLLQQQNNLPPPTTITSNPHLSGQLSGRSLLSSTGSMDWMRSLKSLASHQSDNTVSKIIGSDTSSLRNIIKNVSDTDQNSRDKDPDAFAALDKAAACNDKNSPQSPSNPQKLQQKEEHLSSKLTKIKLQEPRHSIDQIIRNDKEDAMAMVTDNIAYNDNMSLVSKDSDNHKHGNDLSRHRQKAMAHSKKCKASIKSNNSMMSDITVLSNELVALDLATDS
mmetsp:Transcript_59563/g.69605  ORF Transcript_59563/g.69605 Transcript_59563/m.69605 type:complete len:755 (-) Transcript_59563:779-3043(-)|eukprot:CAMPEP_0194389884 /NCGR_PEP_ID=MMETSP0174-20130528/106580_1 /TAXON_ID=216777 /ORGANISM="Proboscia alata, Strain PI-D3" /LENGTH=754 /DNA_ID=CAMNT_0039182603 /DNA_START=196 /DNA_END=2460 /DNA_ORIENTATION=+